MNCCLGWLFELFVLVWLLVVSLAVVVGSVCLGFWIGGLGFGTLVVYLVAFACCVFYC